MSQPRPFFFCALFIRMEKDALQWVHQGYEKPFDRSVKISLPGSELPAGLSREYITGIYIVRKSLKLDDQERMIRMRTVWIATGNAHKAEEFREILGDDVAIKTLADFDEPLEIDETGKTFEENALIKARALHEKIHQPVISDDSGLEVDALDKAPGVYSARFMGEDTSYDIKNQAILDAVKGKDRTARFVCVIAWIDENGVERTYRGTMEGQINDKIEGENGFGYDPIFYYPPFGTTSSNVPPEVKNASSHRGNALRLFIKDWKQAQ